MAVFTQWVRFTVETTYWPTLIKTDPPLFWHADNHGFTMRSLRPTIWRASPALTTQSYWSPALVECSKSIFGNYVDDPQLWPAAARSLLNITYSNFYRDHNSFFTRISQSEGISPHQSGHHPLRLTSSLRAKINSGSPAASSLHLAGNFREAGAITIHLGCRLRGPSEIARQLLLMLTSTSFSSLNTDIVFE